MESTRGNFDKVNEILTIEEFKELVFFYWENIFKNIFINIFKNIKKQGNIKLSSINFKKMSVSDGLGYGGLIHKLELSISAISGVYYYGVSNYINGLSINEREILFLQSFLIIIDNNIDLYINVLNKITGLKDIKFEELGTHLLFLYTCYYDFLSPTDESLTFMDKYIDVKSFVNEETIKLNYYDFIDNIILKAKDIHNCKEFEFCTSLTQLIGSSMRGAARRPLRDHEQMLRQAPRRVRLEEVVL